MNILYVESSRSWGGQEYRTCLEANWLNARGHQAWLICNPNSEVLLKARELGTRAIAMPLRRRIDPLCWWRLWRFCRRNQIDLIKTYSSKDHWLALPLYLCGIPVARARCITDPIGNKWRAFIFKHGCSKIVADASVIKRQLVQQNGIDPAKIEVIGSAVDLQKFNPSRDRMKFRREMGFTADTPFIASIGMIRPDKGQLILIDAARLVLSQRPDARFVIVGQGTGYLKLGEKVRNAINRAGLADKVFMIGYRWDTPDIFAACDMVAIASLRTEASPIVLREAFASGRPVVATKVGDIPEIIEPRQNGLLVEPGDSKALAAAILEFLSDQKLAAHCATNGLRYARQHFSFDRMMQMKLQVDASLSRTPKARLIPSSSAPNPQRASATTAQPVSRD
ncbi:MAG TPA: glycosyltransferase family 4 protein [Chthoniobacterales bacterium]|nr:glycosyltransferase family 4 protein [Chthoniobacterales bacterium]